jgi:Ca-activated chloride channel homolog
LLNKKEGRTSSMELRSRARRVAVSLVAAPLLCVGLLGLSTAQTSNSSPAPSPSPSANPSPSPAPAQNSNPPQSDANGAPQDAEPQQAQDDQAGGFVFKKEVEEVVLHAVVVDDQNHLVTSLGEKNFRVFEDGKPQDLTFFRKEHVPVSLGILIDNSGSMLPKRANVSEAALQLVDASQQKDRVFVVNFGDDAYLDQDYTDDVTKLKAALMRTGTHGSTALYDALIASVDHLSQTGPQQKKVLLLVTDGRDNASQATYSEVLRKLQSKNGPVLYTIALAQREEDRQALRKLSEQTGGTAYFPDNLDNVQAIAKSIAEDIRSQYVIGYRSSNPQTAGRYHTIQVQAAGSENPLRVSTRAGYYSGELGANQ